MTRRTRFRLGVVLVALGIAVLEFGIVRYLTTKTVLTTASANLLHALRAPDTDPDSPLPDALDDAALERVLGPQRLSRARRAVGMAGGYYYGWNSLAPWVALGTALTLFGVLLPITRDRPAVRSDTAAR